MYNNNEVRAFAQKEEYIYRQELTQKLISTIQSASKEYILNIPEEEYISYILNKFELVPLTIDKESEHIAEPFLKKERRENNYFGGTTTVDIYNFKISYFYSGSKELFGISPSTKTIIDYPIRLEGDNIVSFVVELLQLDANDFNRIKNRAFESAFTNVVNVNNFVANWNNSLRELVEKQFKTVKEKYINENSFFAAINVKTNRDTSQVFSVPTVKKIDVPKPQLQGKKTYTPEPTMADVTYQDILNIIYSVGQSMERKPSLYQGKNEEALRDQFLLFLETRYEGTTATGETFNKNGKTDILLKHQDGSNLFIVECKIWHGQKQFLEAISQLFDRYLTWRDSKVAVMMFVKNKEFSKTIETVKTEVVSHQYFVEALDTSKDSSFSYKFHLKDDKEKAVFLEVMLFHFPEDN
jgi:hypothetical protein